MNFQLFCYSQSVLFQVVNWLKGSVFGSGDYMNISDYFYYFGLGLGFGFGAYTIVSLIGYGIYKSFSFFH